MKRITKYPVRVWINGHLEHSHIYEYAGATWAKSRRREELVCVRQDTDGIWSYDNRS